MNEFKNNDSEVIILSGVFADENEKEVERHAKIAVEYSANSFQKKLIKGFRALNLSPEVISAPFIGSFPNNCDIFRFNGFACNSEDITYVSFNNAWGYRNISRKNAVKKELKKYIKNSRAKNILIVSYSAHEPFAEAAAYAKQLDDRIKICLVIPDLPQYMNLSGSRSKLYDFVKRIDIKKFSKYSKYADSFVVLTEYMYSVLEIGSRPYMVAEGIADHIISESIKPESSDEFKYIVYTGKLYESFGIKNLVNAFLNMDDKSLRLVLCGSGDCGQFIEDASKRDSRIIFTGQVSPSKAEFWRNKASVLINPRGNTEEYVKYSFPSKTIEYLETGKPVVAYLLKGMPRIYSEFIYEIDESLNPVNAVSSAVNRALNDDKDNIKQKHKLFAEYSNNHLYYKNIVRSLLELNDMY